MLLSIIVRVMVTGILAIVPSQSDSNLTRIIVPNHMPPIAEHRHVPAHFAFLEVPSTNVVGQPTRPINLKFHVNDDPKEDERWVFVLRSDEVSLETEPTNSNLIKKAAVEGDKESTFYELKMDYLCPKCSTIANEYFTLSNETKDKIAARMDLRGGEESVDGVNLDEVWDLPGKDHDQSYGERVVYQFEIPAATETLKIRNVAGTETQIVLKPDSDVTGGHIEVILGNAPLQAIVSPLDKIVRGTHSEDHFKLLYDLYQLRPWYRRVPKLKQMGHAKPVVGPHDNCKPPIYKKQDPK